MYDLQLHLTLDDNQSFFYGRHFPKHKLLNNILKSNRFIDINKCKFNMALVYFF